MAMAGRAPWARRAKGRHDGEVQAGWSASLADEPAKGILQCKCTLRVPGRGDYALMLRSITPAQCARGAELRERSHDIEVPFLSLSPWRVLHGRLSACGRFSSPFPNDRLLGLRHPKLRRSVGWCSGGDSNPYGLLHRLLRPTRMPFRHPSSWKRGIRTAEGLQARALFWRAVTGSSPSGSSSSRMGRMGTLRAGISFP